jgi:hypothetical protein
MCATSRVNFTGRCGCGGGGEERQRCRAVQDPRICVHGHCIPFLQVRFPAQPLTPWVCLCAGWTGVQCVRVRISRHPPASPPPPPPVLPRVAGNCLLHSRIIPLTESELEYLCDVQRHVFPDHLVLQFTVKNTIPEQLLTNVCIDVLPSDASWVQVRRGACVRQSCSLSHADMGPFRVCACVAARARARVQCWCSPALHPPHPPTPHPQEVSLPAAKVRCGVPASAYVAFRRGGGFPATTFQCEVRSARIVARVCLCSARGRAGVGVRPARA